MESDRHTDTSISRLALKFSSLDKASGISPWSPVQLDIWASEIGRSASEVHSARFVLSVWNNQFDWDCGRFNPKEAILAWDRTHRRAFLDYVSRVSDLAI